jgi:hypothetical protein
MFSSFDSTQTPAVKWWDFSKTLATAAQESVSLEDDCAPIQYFATGGGSVAIKVYLPSNPPKGKQLTIRNDLFSTSTTNNQLVNLYDSSNSNKTLVIQLGVGSYVTLAYIQFGATSSWITLNIAPATSKSPFSNLSGTSNSIASGSTSAVIAGGASNVISATSTYATIGGGQLNTIGTAGEYSTIGGGNLNNVTGQYSTIPGGGSNGIGTGCDYGVVAGGSNSVITNSALVATISGGTSHTIQNSGAAICGGTGNTANGDFSTIVGGTTGLSRGITGLTVIPANNTPSALANTSGGTQTTILNIGADTTNATPTVLKSDVIAAGTTNQLILANNAASTFQGQVTALASGTSIVAAWTFTGAITRTANAASTRIVGTPSINLVAQDASASTWAIALSADTTNGGLAVTVTGAASVSIIWLCTLITNEVTF